MRYAHLAHRFTSSDGPRLCHRRTLSFSDIGSSKTDLRFTPINGLRAAAAQRPFRAKPGSRLAKKNRPKAALKSDSDVVITPPSMPTLTSDDRPKPMPANPISDPVSFRRTIHHDEILREAGYDVASIQNLRGLPGWWGEVRLSW